MELLTRNRWVDGRFVGLERPLACPLFGAVAGATVGVMALAEGESKELHDRTDCI